MNRVIAGTDPDSQNHPLGRIIKERQDENRVRQGNGLSQIFFKCLLEKVIREWTY